jgi:hypothetical protein
MRAGLVPSPQLLHSAAPDLIPAHSTLRFSDIPLPNMGLTFLPQPLPSGSRKRGRAAADIDGEHSCMQKKKRRLRLVLITSRLSPQYSYPATNIVDRGSSKIAVWAKQKGLGQNMLRKAAILNRIRCESAPLKKTQQGNARVFINQTKEQRHIEMAKLTLAYGSVDTHTRPVLSQAQSAPPLAAVRVGGHFLVSGSPTGSPSSSPTTSRSPSPTSPSPPLLDPVEQSHSDCRSPNEAYAYSLPSIQIPRKHYTPPPPSPLGLSNYDAFDSEDDIPDPYSHLDDDEDDIEPSAYMYADERHDSPVSPCTPTTKFQFSTHPPTAQHLESPQQQASSVDTSKPTPQAYASFNDAHKTWSPPAVTGLFSPEPTRPEDTKTAQSPNVPLSHSPNFFTSTRAATSPHFTPFTY